MRVIERRIGANAFEFLHADLDCSVTRIVLEMGNGTAGHGFLLSFLAGS
jgi:hypothetical protein